jgi:hypothetical protein
LKKEPKDTAPSLSGKAKPGRKSFLLLFFKKEVLPPPSSAFDPEITGFT